MAPAIPSSRRTNNLNDVFVLGAGASVPYGFPTGSDLLQRLREEKFSFLDKELVDILEDIVGENLKENLRFGPFRDETWDGSRSKVLCEGWSRKVRGSLILTIDQFLRNQKDETLRKLGKRLMARQILAAEKEACVAKDGKKSMHALDWIQEFLTRVDLLENWQEYLESTTFITYNYDRVLEFFVHRYLVVDKGFLETEATEIVDKMCIYHINGYLGSLNELPLGNQRPIPGTEVGFDPLFDSSRTTSKLVDWPVVSSRFRTVWEDPGSHPEASGLMSHAREAVARAKRIFVMGASFIPENMEAIGLARPVGSRRKGWRAEFSATSHGLTDAQVDRARKLLGAGTSKTRFPSMVARDFVVDFVNL